MQMAMIVYNEVIDDEVMEILKNCAMTNYTKLMGVYGKGNTSGMHLGNDIWPGQNNILYVVCDERQAKQMLSCIRELRKQLGHEGVKAFVWTIAEVT